VIPSRRSLVAVALVAVFGVSACTSDPSPTRVAQDLVETVSSTPEQEECMLDVIDQYELDDLGKDANNENPDISGPAQEELDAFEADLAACLE
jgi:hypothetical protein